MSAPELWAWAPSEDAEEWEGPFATRAEAEACGHVAARSDRVDGYTERPGVISRAEWIDRDQMVRDMADGIVEDILDHLNDETPWGDGDGHFGTRVNAERIGAEQALGEMLVAWAAVHLTGIAWHVTGDCEPVTLPTEPAK